jgi:D-alanyl-D-alanine carboxypeptidase/D-alanyl-D-alanine-endopeptidase (penicillin-binding protein 4)
VHPQSQMFVSSLAVAGESGTARRLANGQRDAARGRAQVKTGTLRDVSGIAGYVTTGSGARYVVVGFINHPEAGKGRPALEALLNWTADLP